MNNLSDKLYGRTKELFKALAVILPILFALIFFISAILFFTQPGGVWVGLLYLFLGPVLAFLSGLGLYTVAKHLENQEKMIKLLDNDKNNLNDDYIM